MSNHIKYDFIVALDPSGAYDEGKGTTGWAVFNALDNKIYNAGHICAVSHDTRFGYYDAHVCLLRKFHQRYENRMCVVMEDYRLYASRATTHIHSRMETCHLIGVLEYFCEANNIPIYFQGATLVKHRWTNEILKYKGLLKVHKQKLIIPNTSIYVDRHMIDAVRHAIHFATFSNKGE